MAKEKKEKLIDQLEDQRKFEIRKINEKFRDRRYRYYDNDSKKHW